MTLPLALSLRTEYLGKLCIYIPSSTISPQKYASPLHVVHKDLLGALRAKAADRFSPLVYINTYTLISKVFYIKYVLEYLENSLSIILWDRSLCAPRGILLFI
jgi:hypothetical protein